MKYRLWSQRLIGLRKQTTFNGTKLLDGGFYWCGLPDWRECRGFDHDRFHLEYNGGEVRNEDLRAQVYSGIRHADLDGNRGALTSGITVTWRELRDRLAASQAEERAGQIVAAVKR